MPLFFHRYTILILLCSCYHFAYSQTAPKYSNEFLNIGVGARALGMGNTQTALAEDATAMYWNPAGMLDNTDKYNIALMHAEYFGGIAQYDYVGFSTPVDKQSSIGVALIRFGIDDIPDTRFLYDANGRIDYNNIRFFSAADYALLVSYARKITVLRTKELQLGGSAKIIYRNAGDFANAWGFGVDAAARLKMTKNWIFAAMLRDATTTFNAWTHNTALIFDIYSRTGNAIPKNSIEVTLPKLTFSVAKYFPIREKWGIQTALDFLTTFDGERNVLLYSSVVSLDPALGIEAHYMRRIFLRLGINNIQQVKNFDGSRRYIYQPNFGVGFVISKFTIDYALTDVGDRSDVLYSNIFSIKLGFGK